MRLSTLVSKLAVSVIQPNDTEKCAKFLFLYGYIPAYKKPTLYGNHSSSCSTTTTTTTTTITAATTNTNTSTNTAAATTTNTNIITATATATTTATTNTNTNTTTSSYSTTTTISHVTFSRCTLRNKAKPQVLKIL